jgi:hypothetical protein
VAPIRPGRTLMSMSLPTAPEPPDYAAEPAAAAISPALPVLVDPAEQEARTVLIEFLPTDPAVRKRVFSSLLRTFTAGVR